MMTFKELFEYRDMEDEYWREYWSKCYITKQMFETVLPLRIQLLHMYSIKWTYLSTIRSLVSRRRKTRNNLTSTEEMFTYWLGAWFYSHY